VLKPRYNAVCNNNNHIHDTCHKKVLGDDLRYAWVVLKQEGFTSVTAGRVTSVAASLQNK